MAWNSGSTCPSSTTDDQVNGNEVRSMVIRTFWTDRINMSNKTLQAFVAAAQFLDVLSDVNTQAAGQFSGSVNVCLRVTKNLVLDILFIFKTLTIEMLLLFRHYNREDEERVSNYLRQLFENAIQQGILQEEASQDPDREERGEQRDRDRDVADIVRHLVQELFREKRRVDYYKQSCVTLGIQVPDIGSAITLIEDFISGKMYSLFAPL
ncbi:hypothetical protein MAR_033316, partial [Mya arenaria]